MSRPDGAGPRGPGLRAADVADLVRLPAVLTVPGDAWAGAAASGWRRGWAMPLASSLLYLGGMALNDWADRAVDARERPERPIPSGRIPAPTALAIGSGMVAGGVGVAALLGGRRAGRLAAVLAAAVTAYDVAAKDTAAGPPAMAACRALDVLLGAAGGRVADAVPAAAAVGVHTFAVTALSRHEVRGTTPAVPRAAAAGVGVAAALATAGARPRAASAERPRARARAGGRLGAGIAAGLAAGYAGVVGRAFLGAAARAEDPAAVRAAVGAGVQGVTGLQAALLAGRGAWPAAAVTAAALPAGRALARRRAVT